MKASTLETIFLIFTLISYVPIISIPFVLGELLKKNNFFILLLLSIVLTFLFSTVSIYWTEKLSNEFMYDIYGFNSYGMSDTEHWIKEISIDNKKTIERIYYRSMGIGWNLKLIISYIMLVIPYNLITCGIIYKRKIH
ncbi:hypothetical protein QJU43_04220 [Pasteurella atlantica]|uniref:Uncharacterized protein n=2 Tax=Pasteurellaceae TaxID=712 RepID=A0ACC6HNN5_9PAST|nr:hypothetical protein [Pasteurella atlantica]MDP8033670.1 hypothetical protein [Pasteurella atlantica]MDP8035550.1 hypothetical protein [Pasteurella atlantica]MDP8037501.1 hypothetical protein [Pasteurella atlantica]MDP8047850.1 hypothetical protein [Pasteurella atlantica]MDP8049805.1 hypothetical protein [Pasteurella atlantica]